MDSDERNCWAVNGPIRTGRYDTLAGLVGRKLPVSPSHDETRQGAARVLTDAQVMALFKHAWDAAWPEVHRQCEKALRDLDDRREGP